MPSNISRRTFASALTAGPLFQGVSRAGDNWSATEYKEWSDKQVEKLLTDSPWCRKVSVPMGAGPSGMPTSGGRGGRGGGGGGMGGGGMGDSGGGMEGGGGGGGGGMGGGGGRGGGGGGGMGGGGDMGATGGGGGRPAMNVVVRWVSALPVQLAMARRVHKDAPSAPAPAYIIGVFDLPPMGMGRGGERGGDRNGGERGGFDPEQMKQRLQEATLLKIKGRGAMTPEKVDMGSSAGKMAAIFYFSNKEAISVDDKEVEFVSKYGAMEIKAKFKLKDMMFDGKLAV